MQVNEGDLVGTSLTRLAGLLEQKQTGKVPLQELRAVVAGVISTFKVSRNKHEHVQKLLNAAATLWNSSLDPAISSTEQDATFKQAALDLQWVALEAPTSAASLPLSHQLRLAEHAVKTAEIWSTQNQWENADAALGKALALASTLSAAATKQPPFEDCEDHQGRCAIALFSAMLLRLRALLRLGQELPASALLLKLKDLLIHASLDQAQRTMFSLDLLASLVSEGERLSGNASLAVQVLQAAHDTHSSVPTAALAEIQAAGLANDVNSLGSRALILLCWAQLDARISTDSALSCVQALQQNPSTAASVAASLLAHRALLQAGRAQEAETELLKLVTHESASTETCAFAMKAALQAPGGAASVRAALSVAQDLTSADDYSLIIDLAETVLAPATQADGAAAAQTDTPAYEVILELLEDDALKEALENDPNSRERLHVLCWNHACQLLESTEAPAQAARFYALAGSFLAAEDTEAVVSAYMALAMCSAAQGDHAAALQHLQSAEAAAPGRLSVAFLRLKTCLAAGDESGAAQALHGIASTAECDADTLRVCCCEALEAGMHKAARTALGQLLGKIQQQERDNAAPLPAGYESVVFQNLIQLLMRDGTEESSEGKGRELVEWLGRLVERVAAVGPDSFFKNEDGHWRQLEWFQVTAWNAGNEASKAGNLDNAARLLALCGEFCAMHPEADASVLRRAQLAYVMSAAADLDLPSDGSAVLAALSLANARSAAAALGERYPDLVTEQDMKAQVFSCILDFKLSVRKEDSGAALAAVDAAKKIPVVQADHFIKMAEMVGDDKNHKCASARKAALSAALNSLTSEPALKYDAVAGVLRALLECCSTDEDRLRTLKEASSLVCSAPNGSFPLLEARYLITNAWNRGATHSKFARVGEAEAFMAVAMKMLRAMDAAVVEAGNSGGWFSQQDKDKMKEEYARIKAAANKPSDGGEAADGHEEEDPTWMTDN